MRAHSRCRATGPDPWASSPGCKVQPGTHAVLPLVVHCDAPRLRSKRSLPGEASAALKARAHHRASTPALGSAISAVQAASLGRDAFTYVTGHASAELLMREGLAEAALAPLSLLRCADAD